MRIHILGVCGTFMAGLARLAIESGYRVSGSDSNIYPPMSTQLQQLGIETTALNDLRQLKDNVDMVVIGNAMSRGMPIVEAVLDHSLPYCSGPAWLAEAVLNQRRVIAVAGTHGKTTTASMITWVLDYAGYEPGYLIGGIPANFDWSARLGNGEWFVIEADEYDSAFFDKRSKFVHYRAEIAVLNNLEFDHADIFHSLDDIKRQFHHFVRIVPGRGHIVYNADDKNLQAVLAAGAWSALSSFSPATSDTGADWHVTGSSVDHSKFTIQGSDESQAHINWKLFGQYNRDNALACGAACVKAGISLVDTGRALNTFRAAKRRLELVADSAGIQVFSDFAHHPTAIALTLAAMRHRFPGHRLICLLEIGSNSMQMGVHRDTLAVALEQADIRFLYSARELRWNTQSLFSTGVETRLFHDIDELLGELRARITGGDRIVLMSNGAFAGLPQKVNEFVPPKPT